MDNTMCDQALPSTDFRREALVHSTLHFLIILSRRVRKIILLLTNLTKWVVASRFSMCLTTLKRFGSSVSYVAPSSSLCLLAHISKNSKKVSISFWIFKLFYKFCERLSFKWMFPSVSATLSHQCFPEKRRHASLADFLLKSSRSQWHVIPKTQLVWPYFSSCAHVACESNFTFNDSYILIILFMDFWDQRPSAHDWQSSTRKEIYRNVLFNNVCENY